jgi:hypothetical protein
MSIWNNIVRVQVCEEPFGYVIQKIIYQQRYNITQSLHLWYDLGL